MVSFGGQAVLYHFLLPNLLLMFWVCPFIDRMHMFCYYVQAKSRQSSSSVEDEIPSQKHMCGSIASTMDEEMFSLVRSKWCLYIDEAQTTKDWGPVAAGVAVMKDMVSYIFLMRLLAYMMHRDGCLHMSRFKRWFGYPRDSKHVTLEP